MKPCIVYLVRNTANARKEPDAKPLLAKSLDLLYQNYNNQFKQDILIFHEEDFSETDQMEIIADREEISFHEIQFEIPGFLRKEDVPESWTDGKKGELSSYDLGYRHMIRFFAVQVYDILSDLGYDWMMRLDDDSFIHTKIDYDIFQFMKDHNYRYGYRVAMLESMQASKNYEKAVRSYIRSNEVSTAFFEKNRLKLRENFGVKLESLLMFFLEKTVLFQSRHFLAPFRCFPYWCYYTNFFISDLSFWKQDNVRSFLEYIDQLGGIYQHRWGDLLIQSTTVQLFMQENEVFQFDDWAYEHATIKDHKLMWGGLYPANVQSKLPMEKDFREKYGRLNSPIFWSKS